MTGHQAFKRVTRLSRYGSRKVKTLIRQWSCCDAVTILGIIKGLK